MNNHETFSVCAGQTPLKSHKVLSCLSMLHVATVRSRALLMHTSIWRGARMFSLLPTADNCSMTVVLVWVGRVGREWHQPSASTEHWSSVSTRACWTSLRMTSSS